MPADPDTLPHETYDHLWVDLDLWSLEAHIGMLKRELPRVIEEERKRIWDGVGDEEAARDAANFETLLDEGETTRLLTGTALIAIWATYESGVKRCADRIRKARNLPLGLRDNKGGFLEQAGKYFDGVLGFKLHTDDTIPEHLEVLYGLRNALAHANGQLEDVPKQQRAQIEKWMRESSDLNESSGSLIVSMDYVEWAFDLIKKEFKDLSTRTVAKLRRIKAAAGAG